jgi:putative endopeptidase
MLTMLGESEAEAAKKAKAVLHFETRLAKASMTLKERRNPDSVYNLMTKDEFLAKMINYDFNAYLSALGIENIEVINIHQPKFFAEVDKMAAEVPLEDWKIYLSWKLINGSASLLSSDIEQARFDFFGSKLSGTPKMQERWKRMVSAINGNLGEAMGKLYVEKYFPQEAKDRMMELVGNLKIALESSIKNLDWMSEVTKTKALEKLNTMRVKVGYPNKWKDYSSVDISPDNYVQNSWNCDAFGYRENLDKIGKPVDREEWGMTPQTVNAYYSPNMNEIVFPAAILQPPFFDLHADDAVNYGAIGVVIGHEMTHGFDDQGRKYDKDGNLNDWWTEADAENFKEKVQILIDQYNAYSMLDSLHIDGHLTLGENIADNGGLYIAHAALMQSYEKNGTPEDIDSLNYNQRFFISYAQVWRQNIRDKELMRRLKEDVHSPGEARVNAGVANLPWWYEAFNITPENKFYIAPEERAKIW